MCDNHDLAFKICVKPAGCDIFKRRQWFLSGFHRRD